MNRSSTLASELNPRPRPARHACGFACAAFWLLFTTILCLPEARGEDVVVIRTGAGSRESTRRLFGTITDVKGGRMTILRAGREESFDSKKVIRFQTTYQPSHIEGRKRFESRNYQAALNHFRDALEREQREWVRREIMASVAICRRNLGQIDVACEAFLIVFELDPKTEHLHAIPLAWRSEIAGGGLQPRAEEWVRRDLSAAQLIGASWLLSGPRRSLAIETLQGLTDDEDVRIAQLAQAQLWRTQLITARNGQERVWEAAVERLPESLRAGPYYMLGQLLARLKQPEEAAIAYLRTPVLHPHQRILCQQSLFAAAGQLEALGQLDDARNVYRELLRDFAGSAYEDEAKVRYQQLEEKRKKQRSSN